MTPGKKKGRRDPAPDLEGPERIYAFADRLQAGLEEEEEEKEELETWVVFGLAARSFGLPVTHVSEVMRVGRTSRVPRAPAAVRGVTNLRGKVLPVVDLRTLLGLGEVETAPESRILVLTSRGRLLGMLVDRVHRVTLIAPSTIRPAAAELLPTARHAPLGTLEIGDEEVVLLDVDNLLTLDDPGAAPDEREA